MDKVDESLDPVTGLKTRVFTSELDGKMHVDYQQNLQPLADMMTKLRNDDDYTKQGIKKGMMHVGSFDAVTIVELRKIGIDFFTASAREIVAGVKKLGKEHLLATRARV